MTFTTLQTEIKERLGTTSTDAASRIGRLINLVYRDITTEIGMNPSRIVKVTEATTISVQEVTFSSTEKIERMWVEDSAGNPTKLTPVFLEELRKENAPSSDDPRRYAIRSVTSNSVIVLLDVVPATAFNIFADVHSTVSDLSGSNEPAFPESFHDMIIAGVLVKEYRRKGQRDLAREEEASYTLRLNALKMWHAREISLRIRQRDSDVSSTGRSGGGAGSATLGQTDYTQTGLITFDRDPSAPFAVAASSAVVTNLDADKLDGLNSTAFALSADSIVAGAGLTGGGTLAASRTLDVGAGTYITANANDVAVDAAAIKAGIKVDEWAAPTDVTTHNASTSAHGFSPKATAPGSGLLSVLAIGNGATVRSDTAIFDTTNPAALGTAGPGSQLVAARRDHVHANPAIDTLAAATDITTLNASASAHGLLKKLSNTATEFMNGAGDWAVPAGAAQKVIQIVAATYATETSSSSSTYAASGLAVSITPTSSSNKVLVLVSQNGVYKTSSNTGLNIKLRRDTSDLYVIGAAAGENALTSINSVGSVSGGFLDAPATTSAISYNTQFASSANSATVYVQAGSAVSSIIAIEVTP